MRAAGLVDGDEEFDSRAIVAAAHGVQFPSEGPLKFDRFSGGYATVRRKLEDHSSSAIRTAASGSSTMNLLRHLRCGCKIAHANAPCERAADRCDFGYFDGAALCATSAAECRQAKSGRTKSRRHHW